jgi:hypothetical protein
VPSPVVPRITVSLLIVFVVALARLLSNISIINLVDAQTSQEAASKDLERLSPVSGQGELERQHLIPWIVFEEQD